MTSKDDTPNHLKRRTSKVCKCCDLNYLNEGEEACEECRNRLEKELAPDRYRRLAYDNQPPKKWQE